VNSIPLIRTIGLEKCVERNYKNRLKEEKRREEKRREMK
jgi:hypothetical protein